jgi:hypothetical protein
MPGDSQGGAAQLPDSNSVQSVMRSATDEQWWSFTAPAEGNYEVRLSGLPRNYGLAAYYPGGSSSTTSSGTGDRVRNVTLRPGQKLTIRVNVGSGGFSATDPYRVSVTKIG